MQCKVTVNADEIRRRLAENNKTLKWLTYRLNITNGYLSQIMCGARNPSPKLRERMMRVLEVRNFDELFTITG